MTTMTLEMALSAIDRSIRALREAGYTEQAAELTEARAPISRQFAHIAKPAQAVDVGALQKGFMTAESCGPDGRYVLKIKFQSLADLQAAHNTLARAISGEKAGPVDGWKLVPIEPTQAMIEKGTDEHQCEQGDPYYSAPDLTDGDAIAIYKAMIGASPAPDKEG